MTPINHIRLVQAAMLAALVAVFVGPNSAFGKPMPPAVPDAFERYAAAHPYGQGVIDTSQAPDVFERYVKSHGSTSTVVLDGRSPDTRDAAYNTQFQVIARHARRRRHGSAADHRRSFPGYAGRGAERAAPGSGRAVTRHP